MRVLMVILNIMAFFGGIILIFGGLFYVIAVCCVPFYATYRAFTEKHPDEKRRYTIVSIASSFTFFMCFLLALAMSKGS